MRTTILKVLVGSRSHGLNDENSDYDYRFIYVDPTSKLLSLFNDYDKTIYVKNRGYIMNKKHTTRSKIITIKEKW